MGEPEMKNAKSCLEITGKVMVAAFFLVAVMGIFSNSYAKGKHGSMKYNAAIVP